MLTQTAVQAAKPRDKPYKISDGNGLYLLIETNGSKLWRVRYFFDNKEKMLSLGAFPDVTIAQARAKRDDARHPFPSVNEAQDILDSKAVQYPLASAAEPIPNTSGGVDPRQSEELSFSVAVRLSATYKSFELSAPSGVQMRTNLLASVLLILASTTVARAMTIEEHYHLCRQRHHSDCEERVQLAKKYGYWINSNGFQKPIR